MTWYHYLPTVNASLNALATILLALGLYLIKTGQKEAHRKVMLAAFGTSVVFLISYLIYHFNVLSVPFTAQGVPRTIYFFVLITHVILAVLVPPLALAALYQGKNENFLKHRKVARWAWPIWMYVSITGVVVYVMLYHLYPSDALKDRTSAAEIHSGVEA